MWLIIEANSTSIKPFFFGREYYTDSHGYAYILI